MTKWSTLLLAALLDSPALYHAFVLHDLDYTTALVRYLIAVVVAALMLAMLNGLANGYQRGNDALARTEAREVAQQAAMDALEVARNNPALMAQVQGRRSTDVVPPEETPAEEKAE
ncbi:hypothetical protein [Planosporangium mesophilum]|uniref:Uncharacterized protein n=1 Tax=Planosporangium mesophilum TaxID=689768 RepID=A0A8J3TJ65_9ACTN|nr:hypothetical protein [Planosporangium mesophilum]NJC86531.1 hypothetical protein [Planosporangium mesophilum]GII26142.1 hypothetical protein Pme01_57390 [Planosporangium mesophilum]